MTDEPFRLIVAGSRTIDDRDLVWRAIRDSPFQFNRSELVHGGANGVDSCAEEIGSMYQQVTTRVFEPDWNEHGKAAGPIRNREMAEYGDALVAVWDGESRGTRSMIGCALDEGLPVCVDVVEVDDD